MAPAPGEPTDAAPADTSPTSEPGVDAVPVLPLAAAVTDGEPPARPRRRRSLALRFGVSFVLGLLLAVGVGAGALYAWGQQYEGRVLPGVRVGSTELGGLTREQAEAEIASAYRFARHRADHAHRPGRADDDASATPTSAAARTPRRWSTRHSRPAARASPSRTSSADPEAAIHGMTLDPAVAYDRDKLAAAVETLATTIDETPVDAYRVGRHRAGRSRSPRRRKVAPSTRRPC